MVVAIYKPVRNQLKMRTSWNLVCPWFLSQLSNKRPSEISHRAWQWSVFPLADREVVTISVTVAHFFKWRGSHVWLVPSQHVMIRGETYQLSLKALVVESDVATVLENVINGFILPITSSETPTSGLILGLRPANERRWYFVTTSLIGWAQA